MEQALGMPLILAPLLQGQHLRQIVVWVVHAIVQSLPPRISSTVEGEEALSDSPYFKHLALNIMMLKRRIFALLIFITQVAHAEVRVGGELFGISGVKEIKVTLPVGSYYSSFNDQFYPVVNNKFQFIFNVDKPVFLQVRAGYNRIFLVVSPGDNTDIKIFNTPSKGESLVITGRNAVGQLWYNKYNADPLVSVIGHGELFDALNAKSKNETLKKLGWFFRRQTLPLDSLYQTKKIDAGFYSLVKTDIRSKQALNMIERLTSLIGKISDKNNIAKYEDLINILTRFAGVKNVANIRTCFGSGFLMNCYSRQTENNSEGNKSAVWGPYGGYFAAPDSIRIALCGDVLLLSKDGTDEFDFNRAFKEYASEFPKSPYLKYIKQSNLVSVDKLNTAAVVLDTINVYNSLQDITRHYQGKPVYIDLWATWCLPCREEFSYYKRVSAELKQKNIVSLFISIDQAEAKSQWVNLIQKNKLTGHHILANAKLRADIKKLVYKNGQITIPRYLFVNSTGVVSNWDAPRPSDPKLTGLVGKIKS
ncbi:hypothetical protein A0256_11685 [Mucilaginibacter sp. PAMC 26640]|nr:hypothetical protein A0256_11685 [Mucilaginibacter sp. PAMC 26640]